MVDFNLAKVPAKSKGRPLVGHRILHAKAKANARVRKSRGKKKNLIYEHPSVTAPFAR